MAVFTGLSDNSVTDAKIASHTTTKITVPETLLTFTPNKILSDLKSIIAVAGDIIYFNGTNWINLGKSVGKYLKSGASAVSWDLPSSSADLTIEGSGYATLGTNQAETELLTCSIPAETFVATDMFFIELFVRENGVMATFKLRLTIGGNNYDITVLSNENLIAMEKIYIFANPDATSDYILQAFKVNDSGVVTGIVASGASATAHWMTTAFTVSLRCSTGATTTAFATWKIYKLKTL